ncbi:MAG: DNRLRE domain-containing protein [Mucilaginibacter sp.]
MKTNLFLPIIAILSIVSITGCQKATLKPSNHLAAIAKVESSSITLPLDSVKLTAVNGSPQDQIAGYLWSQISGPNEAMIIDESSPSAWAKHLVVGKYLFQLMLVDNAGLTAIDTVGVTVNPGETQTLTLSPSNNPYETNIGILGSDDASNHTSIEEPLAAWTIDGTPITVRNLLKFDLSSIPAHATILSADLYMYSDTIPKNGDLVHANYGTDNSFVVQQVAAAWDPTSVTWFNQPQGLMVNQVVVPSTTQPFLNLDINVKDMVTSMVSGNANYGFKLSLINEVQYTSRIFCSSYYSDASRHPKLVVTYKP